MRTSDEALWTGRFWSWRVPTPAGERYFAFYLMAARHQAGSSEVSEPRPPSYGTTVVDPAGWLIRGGTDVEDQVATDSALDDALTDLAWSMVEAVEQPSR
ncbi:hypothetical protein [Gordonia sp. KTR9]|uniref:hypothetical protein n=1 Tax=Gordonia sp. KTR9 TaxID=337191 RepID=UPI0003078584|nr:hypothetical protein [Gordonia sp. KTR9]